MPTRRNGPTGRSTRPMANARSVSRLRSGTKSGDVSLRTGNVARISLRALHSVPLDVGAATRSSSSEKRPACWLRIGSVGRKAPVTGFAFTERPEFHSYDAVNRGLKPFTAGKSADAPTARTRYGSV